MATHLAKREPGSESQPRAGEKRQTALITGGSSGLGLEMAAQLAAKGYDLILVARDPAKLKAAQERLQTAAPAVSISTYACDVADEDRLLEVFADIRGRCASIDFLILNAAVATVDLLADYKCLKDVTTNIKINFIGAVSTAYLSTPLLVPGSHILFVSSGYGLVGAAGYSLYAGAKGGMNNFADALRREMLPRGISVHVACPGDIDTPLLEGELKAMPAWIRDKTVRAKPLPAAEAARCILGMCAKGRYMIIPSKDVTLLVLVQKLLPRILSTYVIDRALPLPPASITSAPAN